MVNGDFGSQQQEDFLFRFGGVGRLVGAAGLERLRQSHMAVIGVGGVGSWAAEALARSGVGKLTLVDFDDICVSNTNRQLHALDGYIGKSKVLTMQERFQKISPHLEVRALSERFDADSCEAILSTPFSFVIDATDSLVHKCLLLHACRERGLPVITAGSAGGRSDPTQIVVQDLAVSQGDPLLFRVRKHLRQKYGWSREPQKPFGVSCVYSQEKVLFPDGDGCMTHDPEVRPRTKALDCSNGLGTASFVTGTFGFFCAAVAVKYVAAGSESK